MTDLTINRLGQLYKLLCEAIGEGTERPVNQTDLDNAIRFPVRGVSLKISMAHKLHKMTNVLDEACGFVLADVTCEDMDDSFNLKAISLKQQGIFQIGYMMADINNIIMPGMRIRRARENAGYTIRSLAEKIEVSPTTIQNIENDKVEPKMSTLTKIAEACGVNVANLMKNYES